MEITDFEWQIQKALQEAEDVKMTLPDFKTEAEEREFWEKHSIADYWKDLRESNDTFKRPTLTPVTLKLDPIVLKKIKMLARKRSIPYNAYIRYLLAKGVEDEIGFKPPGTAGD